MQDKLAQLTEKLYGEGLEKGRREAEELLAKAQAEAKAIVDKAKREAAALLTAAQKEADTARETAEKEVAQAGKNTLSAVRQALEDLLLNAALAGTTAAAFADAAFIKTLALAATERFNVGAGEAPSLSVLLPADRQAELEKAFGASAKQALDRGVELVFDKGVKAGFKVGPKGGGYYLSFTEQDFLNLFKEYLRPKVRTLLFGE